MKKLFCRNGWIITLFICALCFQCDDNKMISTWEFEHIVLKNYFVLDDAMNGECAIVDINGDGHQDLWWSAYAFVNAKWDAERYERHKNLSQMAWYKGPDFQEQFRMYRGVTHGGNWIDLDKDGDMDCVTGRAINSGELIWLENPGNPEDLAEWPYHFICTNKDINPDMILFQDLNQDGREDIVIQSFRNDVHFLLTPPDLKTDEWLIYHIGHSDHYRTGASLGDVDNDGDVDVVWGHGWLENPGDPTQVPWVDHIIDPDFHYDAQSVVLDLDRDGRSDIILSGEEGFDGLAWYSFNSPEQKWMKHKIAGDSTYSGLHSLRVADFDLDGDMDIFTAEMHMSGYIQQIPPHKVTVFENVDIKKNEWKEHIIAETGSHNAKVGDINSDGYPDMIGSNWNNRLECCPLRAEIWLNKMKR